MKKIIFSTMIASLLAFVGCQNEELVNDNVTDNSGKKVILTANIQGSSATRVALTTDTDENENPIVKVDWSDSGEKFKVYGIDEDGDYYGTPTWFTQIEGTNQFEGTLPASHNGTYLAVYGDDLPSSDQPLQYFLDEQDGTLYQHNLYYEDEDVSIYKSSVLMLAEFSNTAPSLTFEHQTAILKPTFTVGGTDINNTITQIVMGNVVYPTTANFSMKEITIAPIENLLGEQTNQTLGSDIYIHLPVVLDMIDYREDHTFTFAVTAGVKEYTGSLTIPAGMSIQAGNLYTANIVLTEINPGDELSYDSSTKTFSVSGPKGFKLLVQWINREIDNTAFVDYKFDGWEGIESISTEGRSAQNISLTTDITLPLVGDGESNWTPIGKKSSYAYTGTFNGNNKTIKNLTIVDGQSTSLGLIAFLDKSGKVQNVILENVFIDGSSYSNTSNSCRMGGIVGQMGSYTEVSGCTVSGKIWGAYSDAGGIVGSASSSNRAGSGTIRNCHFTANSEVKGQGAIGGIVGSISYTTVDQCTNSGKLERYSGTNTVLVGGIVGESWHQSKITNCVNSGTLTGTYYVNLGGILGYCSHNDSQDGTSVEDCTNTKDATLDVDAKTNTSYGISLGGIVGCSNKSINIKRCMNHANMLFTGGTLSYAGGILASHPSSGSTCNIESCGNTGNITIRQNEYNNNNNNNVYVGGILGGGSKYMNFYSCWTKDVVEYKDGTAVTTKDKDGFGADVSNYTVKRCYTASNKTEGYTDQEYLNELIVYNQLNSSGDYYQWVKGENGGWPTLVKKN